MTQSLRHDTQASIDIDAHKKLLSCSMYDESKKYTPLLSDRETEKALKEIDMFFGQELENTLSLQRRAAPLFVLSDSGINDGLSGSEKPVSFDLRCASSAQIVHSLAKWKRMALFRFGYEEGSGIYTEMKAVRRDEDLSPIHSYLVDQWDWELVLTQKSRTIEYLKSTVRKIYQAIRNLESHLHSLFPSLPLKLPEELTFVTTQELEDMYTSLSPKERERAICKKYGAVFIMQVGKVLSSGSIHDARAPDYDDWELNGDILVYYDVLGLGLELSSMGIRVNRESLQKQLAHCGREEDMKYEYHQLIAAEKLPLTIGGGIGRSRLSMFILKKLHIGEVQASVWPEHIVSLCKGYGLSLL
ncbi:aspartate--ammonia ligase [Nematocida homosporus]|uniref:aspartate--ammonia ligase n=1 Tax=Nematocida homosporus TaxID=1912981 RepID=UPI00221F618B|nr:aspartate--ammonia ligase [Nematocida homosporus]KAI5185697.1 aspartate--ammonia ligase [Nematocida homosporus]